MSYLHDELMPDAHDKFSLSYLIDDTSEEEEEEVEWAELEEQFVAMYAYWKDKWRWKWQHEQVNWLMHVEKLTHQDMFDRTYWMSLNAFNTLLELLWGYITFDILKSLNSCNDPIYPKLVLTTGLHWLAGGSYLDIKEVYNFSRSSYYWCRDTFLDAVLDCEALAIKFPEMPEEIEQVWARFEAKSSQRVMQGCVGALDGLLARICCPTATESDGNPRAYHSGHYNDYGLNVQAICDSCLRFLFFAVTAPGWLSDLYAFEDCSLGQIINNLPDGVYIMADAAYMLSEHILVPFTGGNWEEPDKNMYNYFLSQLCIQIEMAFGLLQNKYTFL